jgi:16S rRNA (guanine966-N2)-methyltransferase
MRVVAGSAGGRRLAAPPGDRVRPTSDRVREAIFNALGSLGLVDGALVVDLFAGTGALGIEALSRGAHHATFVDADPRSLAVVRANLAATGLADRADVVKADALAWVAAEAARRTPFDLAFADPPYRFDRWPDLLAALPAGWVVVESDRSVDPPSGWGSARERRYGTTVVGFLRRGAPDDLPSVGDYEPPGPPDAARPGELHHPHREE